MSHAQPHQQLVDRTAWIGMLAPENSYVRNLHEARLRIYDELHQIEQHVAKQLEHHDNCIVPIVVGRHVRTENEPINK
jgi:hypothetical protein